MAESTNPVLLISRKSSGEKYGQWRSRPTLDILASVVLGKNYEGMSHHIMLR